MGELGDLSASRRLFDADSPATYAATGHLLFNRGGALLAQRFDVRRLETSGQPFPVVEAMTTGAWVSASAAGPIAYRPLLVESGQRRLAWVNRAGVETSRVDYEDTSTPSDALSRDGRRVATNLFRDNNMDIRWYDVDRRTWNRATFDPADDIFPLWSPDGRRLAFGSNRAVGPGVATQNLYWMAVDGAPNSEKLLLQTPDIKFLMDWSADGSTLLFDVRSAASGVDIWALPIDTRQPYPVLQTEFNERQGQFAPNGRWIAYQSDKTGRNEIYLRPLRAEGGDVLVSTAGGAEPRWNPDGSELFYIAADDELMSVPLGSGAIPAPGVPMKLFPMAAAEGASGIRPHYSVGPGARSFMVADLEGATDGSPITVILNWAGRP